MIKAVSLVTRLIFSFVGVQAERLCSFGLFRFFVGVRDDHHLRAFLNTWGKSNVHVLNLASHTRQAVCPEMSRTMAAAIFEKAKKRFVKKCVLPNSNHGPFWSVKTRFCLFAPCILWSGGWELLYRQRRGASGILYLIYLYMYIYI